MKPGSFFHFSHGERNGILILIILLISFIIWNPTRPAGSKMVSEDSLFFSLLSSLEADSSVETIRPFATYYTAGYSPSSDTLPVRVSAIRKHKVFIELNTAKPELLETLPGIGEKLSLRIIRYRDLLGGFYSVEQLKEVYGLSLSVYQMIEPSLKVDSTMIRVLGIDTVTFKTLLRHPYLDYESVKLIMNLRDRRKISEWDSYKGLIPDSVFLRLKPYCK